MSGTFLPNKISILRNSCVFSALKRSRSQFIGERLATSMFAHPEHGKWLNGRRDLSADREPWSIPESAQVERSEEKVRVCKIPMRLLITTIATTFVLSLFLLVAASTCHAQVTPPTDDAYLLGTNRVDSTAVSSDAIPGQPQAADPAASASPQASTTSADNAWHFAVSPYLWFPGMHGTATGTRGNGLGFRASPGDLLSNVRFGLMGAVEARRQRLVLTGDMMWIRLEDDKALPFPGILGAPTSANMKATEFLLAPKVGYRLIDEEKIKIDALAGFRYWHLGENLQFNPSVLGLNFSGSQNFVDPLVGGRIQAALSPKIVVNILGDVGGWGTGSQLEYQVAGLLGYRIKPRWTLQAGYRYLNVDYTNSRGIVFNATTAGVMFGVTLSLK
jgi:hypothetical protein